MVNGFSLAIAALIGITFGASSCSMQEDQATKPAPAPAPATAKATGSTEKPQEKAKAEKARGDVGLLDTEKNTLILVTKEGKLITLEFDNKTKVTQITPTPAKVSDIGLGSSATVTYTTKNDKKTASAIEFKAAKGGD
ncbi:MAG TPA: hypothetical protein VNO43_04650 [Candidatus Eisenbacteria bacterium]|nr:hypothetical protein [Candidatus Eisenbacteria bacterium]